MAFDQIRAHRPIFKLHKIISDIVLKMVPIKVPCMASLALPIACSEEVRGDWI